MKPVIPCVMANRQPEDALPLPPSRLGAGERAAVEAADRQQQAERQRERERADRDRERHQRGLTEQPHLLAVELLGPVVGRDRRRRRRLGLAVIP